MKFFADNEDYKKSLLSTASAPGRPEAVPPEQWMRNLEGNNSEQERSQMSKRATKSIYCPSGHLCAVEIGNGTFECPTCDAEYLAKKAASAASKPNFIPAEQWMSEAAYELRGIRGDCVAIDHLAEIIQRHYAPVAAAHAQREQGLIAEKFVEESRRRMAEGELQMVDATLARRPAIAGAPNRYAAIERAFNEAGKLGPLQVKLNAAEAELTAAEAAHAQATDKELTRWQNSIYEMCKKVCRDCDVDENMIDGGGCDSGDPLDFTEAEISQAFAIWRERAEAAEAALTAEKEAHAQELAKLKPCSDEDCELKLQRYYTFMDALGVVREPINERNEIVWINARAVAAEAARDRQYEFNIGQIAKLAAAEAALTAAKARIEELEGILGDAHLLAKSTEAALEELLGEDNV